MWAKSEGNCNHMILPLKRWLLVNAHLLAKHNEKGVQPYSNEKNCYIFHMQDTGLSAVLILF